MVNKGKLVEAVAEWLTRIAYSVLPQVQVPPTSGIGKFMSMIGVDVAKYNVWNELGFLLTPTIKSFVTPTMAKYLDVIPDEKIPEVAEEYVNAMIARAKETEYINIFGIQVGQNAFEDLKNIIQSKFA